MLTASPARRRARCAPVPVVPARYLVALLEDGFGLGSTTALTVAKAIGEIELVWTLGAMLAMARVEHAGQPTCPAVEVAPGVEP